MLFQLRGRWNWYLDKNIYIGSCLYPIFPPKNWEILIGIIEELKLSQTNGYNILIELIELIYWLSKGSLINETDPNNTIVCMVWINIVVWNPWFAYICAVYKCA